MFWASTILRTVTNVCHAFRKRKYKFVYHFLHREIALHFRNHGVAVSRAHLIDCSVYHWFVAVFFLPIFHYVERECISLSHRRAAIIFTEHEWHISPWIITVRKEREVYGGHHCLTSKMTVIFYLRKILNLKINIKLNNLKSHNSFRLCINLNLQGRVRLTQQQLNHLSICLKTQKNQDCLCRDINLRLNPKASEVSWTIYKILFPAS
jgi:hypothetical protein